MTKTATRTHPKLPVLVVDDEKDFLLSVKMTLRAKGISNVATICESGAFPYGESFSCVLLDINMPGTNGLDILERLALTQPELPVVMLTADEEVETVVRCMKAGAFDYLVKPVDDARLTTTVERAVELSQVRRENTLLKEGLLADGPKNPEAFDHIVTESAKMISVFKYVEAIAASALPVLITGETGTGKELFAKALHRATGAGGPFVAVNLAGLDDSYLTDTLFGHKRGAFTGADSTRGGLVEKAAGGTIFLDEIGDVSPETQVKLLRLLQEKRYYPLGSDQPKRADARIVLATNRNLEEMVTRGDFRQDLYYRLMTHRVELPPLRDRVEDIPALFDHFLTSAADKLNKKPPTPPREIYTLLANHGFPGNVRELEALVFDAVSRHEKGVLSMAPFLKHIFPEGAVSPPPTPAATSGVLVFPETLPTLKEAEDALIDEAFRRTDNNQTLAARMLGISRRALNNRLVRKKKSTRTDE